jgi:hypothetical protein
MTGRQLADANQRIAEQQPTVEAEMAGWFGLSVVGRFARRHGIDVRLVPSRPTGVTAKVLLPAKLLSGTPGTPPAPAAAAGAAPPPLPPRPAQASPLGSPAPPAPPAAAAGPSLVSRALQTGTAAQPPAPTLAPVSAATTGSGTGPTNGTANGTTNGTANGSLTLVGAETSDWPRTTGDDRDGGGDQPRPRASWLRRRRRRSGNRAELAAAPVTAPEPASRPDGEVARPSPPGEGDG